MKKAAVVFGLLFILISAHNTVHAQWALGASYEVRSEEPENGFGFRLEKGIFQDPAILDLGIRAHFSYFNDENNVTVDDVNVSGEVDVYDYGLAAIGGIRLGLVKPYVGLGVGSQQFKFDIDPNVDDLSDESSFYWNGFGGAEITLFPFFNPFIEYRIARLSGTEDIEFDNISRLALGFNLRF